MPGLFGGDPPKPDPAIAEAAKMQAQTGQEWLAFSKEQFQVTADRVAQLDQLQREIGDKQLAAFEQYRTDAKTASDRALQLAEQKYASDQKLADEFAGYARQDRQRYETTFKPIEDEFVREASTYASPERQAAAAAEARGDVQFAAGAAREQAAREAAGLGINPNSGRFAGIRRTGEMSTALASAGAANTARQQVRDKGLALKGSVVDMGRGLPAQSMAGLQTAAGISGTGTGTLLNTLQGTTQTGAGVAGLGIETAGMPLAGLRANNAQQIAAADIGSTGYRGQMAGYSGQASTLQGLHNSEVNTWAKQQDIAAANFAGIMSALGGVAGLFIGSDPNTKTNRKRVKDGAAIEAIKQMPVDEFDYKNGAGPEGRHVGPMADDFAKATGKGDGKSIAVQDIIGTTVAAVQDLDRKVDKIAAAVGVGVKRGAKSGAVAGIRRAA